MFEKKDKNFTVRLSAAEYDYLQLAAAEKSLKAGAFLRLLLEEYKQLTEQRKEVNNNG